LLAGPDRVDDVRAYEFMPDFRVHARLRTRPGEKKEEGKERGAASGGRAGQRRDRGAGNGPAGEGGTAVGLVEGESRNQGKREDEKGEPLQEEEEEEVVVKAAFMTLPPAIGLTAIAPSCYA
jgi:hypothetical protein